MKRQEKEIIAADVAEKVSRAKSLYLADFSGLSVEKANELRREFRKSGVDYRVVKNTLVRRALRNASGFEKVLEKLNGPTAIALSYDDPISPAKIIQKFIEKHGKPRIKICVVENRIYDGSKLDELARLPTRREVISSVLGSIQSPVVGIIGAVQGLARDLVNILNAIEGKKESSA